MSQPVFKGMVNELQQKAFLEGEPYVINNFPSSYLSLVHPTARKILHAGEIDPAIHSLVRDAAESVVAVDINPVTVALGLWKKEAIRQLERLDYAALIADDGYNFEGVYQRREQIKPDAYRLNARIMENLPPDVRGHLEHLFENGFVTEIRRGDDGKLTNLHYLEPTLYDTVRDRLEKLDIQVGDIFDLLPVAEVDLISMNNVFDYVTGDVKEKFQRLAKSLKRDGRLVIGSTNGDERGIIAYVKKDGEIRLPTKDPTVGGLGAFLRGVIEPEGYRVLLSEVLKHYFPLELTSDPIVSYSARRRAFRGPVAPVVNSYPVLNIYSPDEGLSEISSASNEKELEELFKTSIRKFVEEDHPLLQNAVFYNKVHGFNIDSDDPYKIHEEGEWRVYLEKVKKEAQSLGISPFEKSARMFLFETRNTPADLPCPIPSRSPIYAQVEVYRKT